MGFFVYNIFNTIKLIEMKNCLSCSKKLNLLIDLGKHHYSNQFSKTKIQKKNKFDFKINFCKNCGLIQLAKQPKLSLLRSKYSNLKSLEPENHLDNLLKEILVLKILKKNSSILGLTYKDESFIKRIKNKGYNNSKNLKNSDYRISEDYGVETIQENFINNKLSIKKKYDLIVLRHILEHSFEPKKFFENVLKMLNNNALIVIEVPSSTKMIKNLNIQYFWEHHICYFDKNSIKHFMGQFNLDIIKIKKYNQSSEDNIVIIAQFKKNFKRKIKQKKSTRDIKILINFNKKMKNRIRKINSFFVRLKKQKKVISLLGVGHLGIKFLNFYNLNNSFNQIIDDNIKLLNLIIPGSKSKIVNSKKMKTSEICFSSLSDESEKKFFKKNFSLNKKMKIYPISNLINNKILLNSIER